MGKTEVECCDVTCIHNENVKLALEQMPDEELLNSLADFYKAFADGTRVKILYVLQKSEMCVCDLAEILGVTQSAVSHQLRMLKTDETCEEPKRREDCVLFACRWTYPVYYQSGYGAYYRIKRYVKMTDQSVFLHLGEAKMQVSK